MKNNILLLLCFCGILFSVNAQESSPEDIVEASLTAYNSQKIDEFMSYFSEGIEMKNLNDTAVFAKGTEAVRGIFEPFFKASPELNSRIVNRTIIGNKVIDHESVTGANGVKEAFEVVVIYEINEGKISRMTMVRKGL